MTDFARVAGGAPVPSSTLVQTDQLSILGDGSHANPLHAVGGSVEVVSDGVTIAGDGTTGSPLRAVAGGVPVTADDFTILGNGTTGNPLRASSFRTIAGALVNSDGSFPGINDHPGFSAVVHTSTGVYTLTLTDYPATANNLIVSVTQVSAVAGQNAWVGAPPNIVVRTFDGSGTLADRIFTIACLDTTP